MTQPSVSSNPDPAVQAFSNLDQLEKGLGIKPSGQDASRRQYIVIKNDNNISFTQDKNGRANISDIINIAKKIRENLQNQTYSLDLNRLSVVLIKLDERHEARYNTIWMRFLRAIDSQLSSTYETQKEAIKTAIDEVQNAEKASFSSSRNKYLEDIQKSNPILKTFDSQLFSGFTTTTLLKGQPERTWLIEKTEKNNLDYYYFHYNEKQNDGTIVKKTIDINKQAGFAEMAKIIGANRPKGMIISETSADQADPIYIIEDIIGKSGMDEIRVKQKDVFDLMKKIPILKWVDYKKQYNLLLQMPTSTPLNLNQFIDHFPGLPLQNEGLAKILYEPYERLISTYIEKLKQGKAWPEKRESV